MEASVHGWMRFLLLDVVAPLMRHYFYVTPAERGSAPLYVQHPQPTRPERG